MPAKMSFSRHREIDSNAPLPMEGKLSLLPKIECGRSWAEYIREPARTAARNQTGSRYYIQIRNKITIARIVNAFIALSLAISGANSLSLCRSRAAFCF
jgi:hypothetical protein